MQMQSTTVIIPSPFQATILLFFIVWGMMYLTTQFFRGEISSVFDFYELIKEFAYELTRSLPF